MSRLLAALTGVAAAAAILIAAPAAARADGGTTVEVTRTQFGIPHIEAGDFRGIGYGYGRSIAADNICTLADMYVTVSGERSRFFGPNAGYVVGGNGTTVSNLSSDFFFQRVKDRGTVERMLAVAPPVGPRPEVADGLRGYVDGYNAWLASVGGSAGVPDPTCRGKAWVRPISLLDAYRRIYQLAILASSGAALEGIGTAQPPGTSSAATAATAVAPSPAGAALAQQLAPGTLDENLSGIGSNAYAIGSAASQDGHGLLYGNPHFPWSGSERFYQSHLTIPGRIDVTGGSLLGVPVVLIGTTRGVAWSHTVSTARRFVPYELTLIPGHPTEYLENGKVRQMTAETVTVQALQPDGALQPRTRTLYSSRQGSITTSVTGLKLFPWTKSTAYALYDGNAENFGRMINTFLGMDEAQSVDDVDANLKRYEGMPWVNTIASDTAGHAYYADIGNVPGISNTKYKRCLTLFGRLTDGLQRLPILDGSRTDCLPGTDPDSAVPGILGVGRLPWLRRDDDVSNMNDSYWIANPAQPLVGYSRIIGDERTPRTLRTRLGIKQLQQRIDGGDGLPGKGFNLDNLRQVVWGNRVYSAELWRDQLVKGCSSRLCGILRDWNMRNDLDEPGAVLWQRFVARLTSTSPVPLPAPFSPYRTHFDANDPVNTPAGIVQSNPIVQWALRKAASDLNQAGLPLDATLRTGQTITRAGQVIPLHGGPAAGGLFNVITSVWDGHHGYTGVTSGDSFMQAVHLLPGCPEVRTRLSYGQSSDPTSPYFIDQTLEYSAKRWTTVPFCGDAVAKAALSVTSWSVPGD